jgi:hypothetical protein
MVRIPGVSPPETGPEVAGTLGCAREMMAQLSEHAPELHRDRSARMQSIRWSSSPWKAWWVTSGAFGMESISGWRFGLRQGLWPVAGQEIRRGQAGRLGRCQLHEGLAGRGRRDGRAQL